MPDEEAQQNPQNIAALNLDEAQKQLHAFSENNPLSVIENVTDSNSQTAPRVLKPWGDSSLAIRFRINPSALVAALNAVFLPARLSGIYHYDTRSIEITVTAFALSGDMKDVGQREFHLEHNGQTHECRFTASSDRLLLIAANSVPLTSSLTAFRNLQSYIIHGSIKPEERPQYNLAEPLSFWISNVDWDDDKSIELINIINFYMSYFDSVTPLVLVHNISDSGSKIMDRDRYVHGSFPAEIRTVSLDQNLISFWNAAHEANPLLAFILYYRIIEYSQFHYMDQKTKNMIMRIMSAPNLTSNKIEAVEKIAETLQVKGLEEIQKFRITINDNVEPKLIWSQVCINRDYFEKDSLFEGGFKVEALITKKDDEANFILNGMERFITRIRKIRNTLSHGKDQETAGVITPTAHNLQMLRPWVNLISIAAGEIVLYRNNS